MNRAAHSHSRRLAKSRGSSLRFSSSSPTACCRSREARLAPASGPILVSPGEAPPDGWLVEVGPFQQAPPSLEEGREVVVELTTPSSASSACERRSVIAPDLLRGVNALFRLLQEITIDASRRLGEEGGISLLAGLLVPELDDVDAHPGKRDVSVLAGVIERRRFTERIAGGSTRTSTSLSRSVPPGSCSYRAAGGSSSVSGCGRPCRACGGASRHVATTNRSVHCGESSCIIVLVIGEQPPECPQKCGS